MEIDVNQMEQVFVNILLNAVDALHEIKDTTYEKRINVDTEVSDDTVVISFSDKSFKSSIFMI